MQSPTCIFTKNVTLPQVFFKHFASKNQLTGFYISGTLVENGLKSTLNQRKPLNKRELKTNSNEEVLSIAKVMTSFGSDYLRNVEYCF